MATSASGIADALVTMFSAASLFGPNNVAKNSYKVLETTTGSCLTVQWVRYNSTPLAFGVPMSGRKTWSFSLKCWVRDTGNPMAAIERVWQATDNIVNCLTVDDTLQGTVDLTNNINAFRDPELIITIGGASWLLFEFTLDAIQFP
jgi:hypothetical protein